MIKEFLKKNINWKNQFGKNKFWLKRKKYPQL